MRSMNLKRNFPDWGAVIIKFWVRLTKTLSLPVLRRDQNNPEKQWKITEEDWRNREKWDLYEDAVDEMLKKTSTLLLPGIFWSQWIKNMPGSRRLKLS